VKMNTSRSALLRWERGASPPPSSYPAIISFLGREPWPEPKSFREQLLAARLGRGLTSEAAASYLGVDASTYWRWESGRWPHRHTDRARCATFIERGAPALAERPQPQEVQEHRVAFDLAVALRSRRAELRMTQAQAGAAIGASAGAVMHWELCRTKPDDRFYPSLIRFLGREPWDEPRSIAARLTAERLRRGLTLAQAAVVLQVDEASIAAWERGDGPYHKITKAKVDAFVTGAPRPWRPKRV